MQNQQALVLKLSQIQIKSVNLALQNLDAGDNTAAGEPTKVIEFIHPITNDRIHLFNVLLFDELGGKEEVFKIQFL